MAVRLAARLLGVAGTDPRPGRGLLIPRCRSVHTFGMRAPIDLVFVTPSPGRLLVLTVHAGVPRRRVVRERGRRGDAVLELAAGEAERLGLQPGAVMRVSGWGA